MLFCFVSCRPPLQEDVVAVVDDCCQYPCCRCPCYRCPCYLCPCCHCLPVCRCCCDNINCIGDLVFRSELMLKTPNFGRKFLNEIKALLTAVAATTVAASALLLIFLLLVVLLVNNQMNLVTKTQCLVALLSSLLHK